MKIVINCSFGDGFRLSDVAVELMKNKWNSEYTTRTDPNLISVIEEIGLEKASGGRSILRIVEIPDEATDWKIDDYDGWESVLYVLDGKILEEYGT